MRWVVYDQDVAANHDMDSGPRRNDRVGNLDRHARRAERHLYASLLEEAAVRPCFTRIRPNSRFQHRARASNPGGLAAAIGPKGVDRVAPLKRLRKTPYQAGGRKPPKSLVVQSSFPHAQISPNQKMTLLSFWGVYRKKDRPYNPVIASGRGAKRRRAPKQATEITKKLAISV